MTQWPELIETDGEVEIPAQRCPYLGERTIRVYVRYPGSRAHDPELPSGESGPFPRESGLGLMLCLHNWGGTGFAGAPDPQTLSARYNVVCIGVDYLQSGEGAPPSSGHPYDAGYLQALDALRGLFYVYDGLKRKGIPFDARRIYASGGSGGGNVSLMANKLGPRTFACIVDLSGAASLTDEVAFGLRAGSDVNAGYSRDAQSPSYLHRHAQQIRDAGNLEHLRIMKSLGNTATVVTIHGVDDESSSISDKRRVMDNMAAQGFDVHPHYITAADLDGRFIRTTGHFIGSRTQILIKFADRFLAPHSPEMRRSAGRSDFEWRDQKVRYPTHQGCYVIDYAEGYPTGRFDSASPLKCPAVRFIN